MRGKKRKKVERKEELTARVKTSKNEKVMIYYQRHSMCKKVCEILSNCNLKELTRKGPSGHRKDNLVPSP